MVLTVYSLFWVMQDFGHQPVDGQNPALPIISNILYHNSHSLESLASCRILAINRITQK